MDIKSRAKMVRAMETICRALNDEEYIDWWLMAGVGDGDIGKDTTDEDLEFYCEDDNFAYLMNVFARVINSATRGEAKKDEFGTFYVDGVISKKINV